MAKKISIIPRPNLKATISPEVIGKAIRAKRTQS